MVQAWWDLELHFERIDDPLELAPDEYFLEVDSQVDDPHHAKTIAASSIIEIGIRRWYVINLHKIDYWQMASDTS